MNLKSPVLILLLAIASYFGMKWYSFLKALPNEFGITGKIDQCCCEAELLKDVNRKVVNLTNQLSDTYFFRIFRVNLNNECPFWAQELLCKNPGQCTICHCDEKEVPLPWRSFKTSPVTSMDKDFAYWDTENGKKKIDWHVEDKENEQGTYVDLKKNPEKYTGYQGQRIWNTIYSENCFRGSMEEMCIEERLLNRIISGLHTSISTQLTEHYGTGKKTRPNVNLFFEKVGNHPERIANLYFAYSVLLRAINRAQDHIQNYHFETGDFQSDIETKRLINELYDITTANCDQAFDESEIFSDITNNEVKERFVTYFHNISRTLDCVDCEVCKVYSKLQTYGMAAALKILFSEKLEGVKEINLNRNELIALINTFNKFSTSIDYIDKMIQRRTFWYWDFTETIILAIGTLILGLWVIFKVYQKKVGKVAGDINHEYDRYKKI